MAVKLTTFYYAPGDKWSCGHLNLTAETPLGLFKWKEVVPGPRHGEDSAELTVTLAGKELNLDHYDHLDFEPPRQDGKWATLFACSRDAVEATLQAWFEDARPALLEFLEEFED